MHRGYTGSDISEEELGKVYDIRIIRNLLGYLKPYKVHIIMAALFSLFHTGVQLLLPYITKIAIDKYIFLSNLEGLKMIVALYFLFLTIGAGLNFGMVYLMQIVGQFVIRDIRIYLFSHLQRLKVAFFDRTPVGRLVTRLTNDGEALNQFFTEVVVNIFTNIIILIGVIIIMLHLDVKLSLVTFTIIPPLIFITNLFRIKARKVYRNVRKWLAQINVRLNETFMGIKVVKIFNQEHENYKKFSAVNHKYYEATMQQVIIYGIFMPLTSLLLFCGTALIIWYGGGEVVQKALTLGTLVAFLSYIRMFFQPIEDISMRFDIMQSSLAACERIFKLMETQELEPQLEACPYIELKNLVAVPFTGAKKGDKTRSPPELRGEIEFKNVWFSYNGADWVLRDVSFRVNPGERVAIVGPTGAGKTSLINLIVKFYEPQKGEILVDGIRMQEIAPYFLRSSLAIVAQDDFIFSGTISDNIRLRNYQISDDDIHKVAKFVNADKFIERLPQTYNQDIKERGTNLSAGELQLLSFARAIAFNPKILILDEATREVDPETESLIQEATFKLLQDRTSIVIAHRLSTIKNVDRIIVLNKGKIIEEGIHAELLQKKGLYTSLYELQYK